MTTNLATIDDDVRAITRPDPEAAGSALAHILGTGDLSELSDEQKAAHYLHLCRSLSLNPASVPFVWIEFEKKLTLYPSKSCADQLRRLHQIRVRVVEEAVIGGLMKVKVEGTTPSGRSCEEVGYVPLTDQNGNVLRGQRYANALMKAHTVAKRRLAFAMVGLSAEAGDHPEGGRRVYLDARGAVIENPTEEDKYLNDNPEAAKASGRPRFETMVPTEASPLEGTPDQRPTADELDPPPAAPRPRPTWRRSDESVEQIRRRWFAIVERSSLTPDPERHRFVEQYTASIGWPRNKQTDSLDVFSRRATDDEVEAMLAHADAIAQGDRRERAADPDEEPF